MDFYLTKHLQGDFDSIINQVIEELSKNGFGIITTIDIKDTFKKKLDVDYRKYRILGACNPHFAYQALLEEDKIGVMLPCNVIIQEHKSGHVEVSAINPVFTMKYMENANLIDFAAHVSRSLQTVLDNL